MFILRFILLVFLWLMVRRLIRSIRNRGRLGNERSARNPSGGPRAGSPTPDSPMQDLTEQDISDADFEEIP